MSSKLLPRHRRLSSGLLGNAVLQSLTHMIKEGFLLQHAGQILLSESLDHLRSSSTWACNALSRPSASASLARAAALWSSRSLQSIGSILFASERLAVLLQHCGHICKPNIELLCRCHSLLPGGRKLRVGIIGGLPAASPDFSFQGLQLLLLCLNGPLYPILLHLQILHLRSRICTVALATCCFRPLWGSAHWHM